MAFSTTNLGLCYALFGFLAMRQYLDFRFTDEERAAHSAIQNHMFTTISHQDIWHRAGFT